MNFLGSTPTMILSQTNSSMRRPVQLKLQQSQTTRVGIAALPERLARCFDPFLTSGASTCLHFSIRPPWLYRLKN